MLKTLGVALGILFSFLFPTKKSNAKDIEHHKINGLNVYLINTHYGNSGSIYMAMQTGGLHDEPTKHAGRHHLFEHVIHAGSERHPGQKTFEHLADKIGVSTNASTYNDRVLYYGTAYADALSEWADLLGALTSAPEWNEETFQKELKAVMDESAKYQKEDSTAVESSIFLELTPPGHWLAKYDVGTQEQLKAMTLEDLRKLYFENYTPETMQIVVAANLDPQPNGKPLFSQEQLIQMVTKSFAAPRPPEGYNATSPLSKMIIPSVVGPGSPAAERGVHLIEMQSVLPSVRTLRLVFEFPTSVLKENPEAYEVFTDFINLNVPGSVQDLLIAKGWIVGLSHHRSIINNLTLGSLHIELTEEGYANRYEVPKVIFQAAHDIAKKGMPADLLEYLKERNIRSYELAIKDANTAAQTFSIGYPTAADPTQLFDFRKNYGAVTSQAVQTVAGAILKPDHMIGAYLGPEVQSERKSKVFERPYLEVTDRSVVDSWSEIYSKGGYTAVGPALPSIGKVNLQFRQKPNEGKAKPPVSLYVDKAHAQAVLEENHESTLGGVSVELTLPPQDLSTATSLYLTIAAFGERFKSQFDYFGSMGVPTGISRTGRGIQITSSGNSGAAKDAILWVVQQLVLFKASEEELRIAREELNLSAEHSSMEFSAISAAEGTKSLLIKSFFPAIPMNRESGNLNDKSINDHFMGLIARADLHLALVGDYKHRHVKKLAKALRIHFPNQLTETEREAHRHTLVPIHSKTAFWSPAVEAKGLNSYGHVRAFTGPGSRAPLKEHAAAKILQGQLRTAIYQLNRAEKGLGYVQDAGAIPTFNGTTFIFRGQTEDTREKFPEIEKGWDEILTRLKDGKLFHEDYEAIRLGAYRSEKMMPRPSGKAEQLLFGLVARGNANFQGDVADAILTVSKEDAYEIGRKMFLSGAHVDVVSSVEKPAPGSCGEYLDDVEQARAKVMGQSAPPAPKNE